jgi:hypothetical protein
MTGEDENESGAWDYERWIAEHTLGTPENDQYLAQQVKGNRWLADQYKDITDEPLSTPPF